MTQPTTFSSFTYGPGTPTPPPPDQPPVAPPAPAAPDLGALAGLPGNWHGSGFNTIWRPRAGDPDHVLEFNITDEELDFDPNDLGDIPNRGRLQGDMHMTGVRYLQRISDTGLGQGIHIEPGLWLKIPSTSAPAVGESIARLASIPHGTSLLAQGVATTIAGPPVIPAVDITPFGIAPPNARFSFPETNLSVPSDFRADASPAGTVTPAMVADPNSVLRDQLAAHPVIETVQLSVTSLSTPIIGGGTANTAFLAGDTAGPNADAAQVVATFWIETLEGQTTPTQLQYSQTVLLNFSGLSWPHVSVATLTRR